MPIDEGVRKNLGDVKGSRTIYSYQVAFRGRQAARGGKKQ